MDNKDKKSAKCQLALENIFDLLLWADKKNIEAMEGVIRSNVLGESVEGYQHWMEKVSSGMTMLIGNVKENGRLAAHVLSERIGDVTLRSYLGYLSREEGIE